VRGRDSYFGVIQKRMVDVGFRTEKVLRTLTWKKNHTRTHTPIPQW
jgi:hypothetical protein